MTPRDDLGAFVVGTDGHDAVKVEPRWAQPQHEHDHSIGKDTSQRTRSQHDQDVHGTSKVGPQWEWSRHGQDTQGKSGVRPKSVLPQHQRYRIVAVPARPIRSQRICSMARTRMWHLHVHSGQSDYVPSAARMTSAISRDACNNVARDRGTSEVRPKSAWLHHGQDECNVFTFIS